MTEHAGTSCSRTCSFLHPHPAVQSCYSFPEPWHVNGWFSGVVGFLSSEAHSLSVSRALLLHACSSSSPTLFLLFSPFLFLVVLPQPRPWTRLGFHRTFKNTDSQSVRPPANLLSSSQPGLFPVVSPSSVSPWCSFRDGVQLFWSPEQFCKPVIIR